MSARHLPVDYSGVVNALVKAAHDYERETGLRTRRILVAPDVHAALLERLRGLEGPKRAPAHESAIDPNSITLHGFAVELDPYAPVGSYEADDIAPSRSRPREGSGGITLAAMNLLADEWAEGLRRSLAEEPRVHPFLAALERRP